MLVRDYRGTGAEMEKLDVICHLLLTLGPAYSTVVTALETMPEDNLTIEFVKCRLLDEETKRRGIGVESFTPKSEQAAFSGSKQSKKKFKCFGCKKEGHKLSDCPVKKNRNQKSDEKPKSKANVAESSSVCFIGQREGNADTKVQWFIDSGCSDHLVNDRSLFEELKPLKCPVEIAIAKDGEMDVTSIVP